jgi:hypothetical protein
MLAVLVAGATVALMPVSASALCDPNGPRGAFVYGIPAADNPVWCESREGPPHHLSRVAMAMAMAMATVLRRQRIGVLRRDGADDCWQSPPSKIAQQKNAAICGSIETYHTARPRLDLQVSLTRALRSTLRTHCSRSRSKAAGEPVERILECTALKRCQQRPANVVDAENRFA